MDRILESHYKLPNSTAALHKEKSELLRKSREMQDPRSIKGTPIKHAKPLEKKRMDSEIRGKGGEKNGRERQSLGRS